jgi:hypothetical protein
MNNRVCYLSQMYQAIPSLVAVQHELGGVFVCGRRSTARYFKKEYPELSFARFSKRFKKFSEGHKVLLNADCIVTGSPYPSLLAPYSAKKMMVFHGTYAGLSPEVLKGLSHFDHLFLIGERMERMLLRHQKEEEFRYTKTGFIPFGHFPDRNERNRQQVLEALGLDAVLKTVVYCPSRRGVGSWELCADKLLREISGEYNLILRPHPSQSMNLRWHEKSSMKAVRAVAKKRGNTLIDLVDIALPDLLMTADLFISDANSPSEEVLFYNTPQLLTGLGNSAFSKIEESLASRNMPEEDIEDVLQIFNCGPIYSQEGYGNWQEAVDDALLREATYEEKREDCFSSIFGQRDRGASQRVNAIIRAEYL